MKLFALIAASAVLAGCATDPYGNYNTYPRNADANGWRTVSVTPVAPGTGARAAASGSTVEYSEAPATAYAPASGYAYAPAYTPAPVYVAPAPYAPYYAPNYWYPPVSIGLGFSFGRSWGHSRGWRGPRGHR